ncbi:MAG: hypothetical protein SO019_04255 [Lachnospiraceae bacterium]|nr:hypothetical protein [Lachnospiraceae bacterium]
MEPDIVGYDVVEEMPVYGPSGITSIVAVQIIQEFIAQIEWRKKHGKYGNNIEKLADY